MNAYTTTAEAAAQDLAFEIDDELTKLNMAARIMTTLLDSAAQTAMDLDTSSPSDVTEEFRDTIAALQWQFDQIRDVEAAMRQMCDDAAE